MRSLDEHLASPTLGDPPQVAGATEGCAGGSCGVLARFFIEVEQGIVTSCSARVRGRAAAFAAASSFCELARGRDVLDAARLGLGTMHPTFAAMGSDDRERALVVEDGFHHAIGNWFLARAREAGPGTGRGRPEICSQLPGEARPDVLVGMSGGVDSAVALHRMLDEHDGRAAGATLRLWIDPRSPDPEAACCSPDSVRRARTTCHAAGAPHLSLDLRSSFARAVVGPFVADYAAGSTPNPCVRCNGTFRIDELVRIADVAGAELVATGHYVRTDDARADGVVLVRRGVDPTKDQSYMLATLDPATVARCTFPLGSSLKVDVRADAAARGLAQATIGDSQEVCFLGGGDYRAFLGRAGALGTVGQVVLDHAEGEVLAQHGGVARFTRGQRRGIGVSRPGRGAGASPAPLFVLDVDPESGRVVVGDAAALEEGRVGLRGVRWHVADRPVRVDVQLRYRARGGAVSATVVEVDAAPPGAVDLVFDDPVRAPAPGQVAVLYDERGSVVGAGTIVRLAHGSGREHAPAPASVAAPVLARGRRAR